MTCVSGESASSQMANIIASWFSASASGERASVDRARERRLGVELGRQGFEATVYAESRSIARFFAT